MKRYLSLVLAAPLALWAVPRAAGAGQIYWVDAAFSAPTLNRANPDGSGAQSLALASQSLPQGIDFDVPPAELFDSELAFSGAHLLEGSVNLISVSPILSGLSCLRGVAVDAAGGKIYWTSTNLVTGPLVERANLDGTSPVVLYSPGPGAGSAPRGIALDLLHGKIYWADFDGSRIQSMPIGGGPPSDVLTGLNGPSGIALDPQGGKMYWTEANANQIRRANLDGSSAATLVTGLATPNYIALDLSHGQMFWTEIGVPRVQKANLDGTGVQNLGVPAVAPAGIAFLPVNTTPVAMGSVAADFGPGYVDLHWSALVDGAVRFQVFRAGSSQGPFAAVSPEIDAGGQSEFSFRDRSARPGTEYYYKVGYQLDGSWAYSRVYRVVTPGAVFALRPAYPNPAQSTLRLDYEIPARAGVRLEIFDLAGRRVRTLVNATQEAGTGTAQWDGRASGGQPVAAGTYFARLEAGGRVATERLVLLR
ncbi:MAG TPA: FlgD immunoglobulin-like domain containing protein [Candidatus Saccharimonadales bacterium]|nr:FlgD immunoglobulin-like domain containing protein [Candidatus Saccharimonadales bacterium]